MRNTTLISVLALSAVLTGQVQWSKITPKTLPTKRSNHSFVWAGDHAILFGGEGVGYLSDTWEWRGNAWKQLTPVTSPTRRAGAAIAYDPLRKVVVVFSGWNGSTYPADTWEFDGKNWKQMAPAKTPPGRDWATMAYDPIGKRLIMFGGHDYRRHSGSNAPGAYGDTWSWDGKNWTQLTPKTSCPKRFGHAMVLDEARKSIVVMGGATPGTSYDDMWEFLVGNWRKVTPKATPASRLFPTMVYDDARKRLVLTSGRSGSTVKADTWEYVNSNWVQRLATGGPNVTFAAAVFDATNRRVFNVGGALNNSRKTPTDQNLTYRATKPATVVAFGAGCKGKNGTPKLTASEPWLGDTLSLTATSMPTTGPAFVYAGLSKTTWGSVKLPYDLGAIGGSGCKLYVEPTFLIAMTNSSGTATFSGSIPNLPALAGLQVHVQAWGGDATANTLGVVVSNAVTGTVGAK